MYQFHLKKLQMGPNTQQSYVNGLNEYILQELGNDEIIITDELNNVAACLKTFTQTLKSNKSTNPQDQYVQLVSNCFKRSYHSSVCKAVQMICFIRKVLSVWFIIGTEEYLKNSKRKFDTNVKIYRKVISLWFTYRKVVCGSFTER